MSGIPVRASRIPAPSRRQSIGSARRESGNLPAPLRPSSGSAANERGSRVAVSAPQGKRQLGERLAAPSPRRRPSSGKPLFDPSAHAREKAEKLAKSKRDREERMAAKKAREAEEREARLAERERLAGTAVNPPRAAAKASRRMSVGSERAAAASPAPTKKKLRVDPTAHARKKQEAMEKAKKVREERAAESKRRLAERKAQKEKEEEERLERLASGGNPFGNTPSKAAATAPAAAPAEAAEPPAPAAEQEEPAKTTRAKRSAAGSAEEQAEKLKRQKQAQLEARMANPDCLRNSSCLCKDCAAFNAPSASEPAAEPAAEAPASDQASNYEQCVPCAAPPVKPVAKPLPKGVVGCLRTSSCTCNDCAELSTTISAESQAEEPPASPKAEPPSVESLCLRNASCVCADCARLKDVALLSATPAKPAAGTTTSPPEPAPAVERTVSLCLRNASCVCEDCSRIKDIALLSATPAKPPARAADEPEQDDKPETEVCLRSTDCRCANCASEFQVEAPAVLGGVLAQAVAPAGPPAEPVPCPDLKLELGNRIDAQDGTGGWYEAFVVDFRAAITFDVKIHVSLPPTHLLPPPIGLRLDMPTVRFMTLYAAAVHWLALRVGRVAASRRRAAPASAHLHQTRRHFRRP